ncbi:unnamed protein product [Merluccius merluccius]
MSVSEVHPGNWREATNTVRHGTDRCQRPATGEGTNYRTAAQQTLTLPRGQLANPLPCPSAQDPRLNLFPAKFSRVSTRGDGWLWSLLGQA